MKLRDLEFAELLGQSQIIGGIDENKLDYSDIDLTIDIEEYLILESDIDVPLLTHNCIITDVYYPNLMLSSPCESLEKYRKDYAAQVSLYVAAT
ncbi:MAG: hypothetical protein WBA77_04810 [Microcoleaceae cyanobacterium]